MTDLNERALGWDDEISKEGPEFILLPTGEYEFEVNSFERGRFDGSEKMPPCNKAILKIKIDTEEGMALITHNLLLHTRTEGFLSAFFASIGQKKKGEPLRMNWSKVTGAKGSCKVGIRKYTDKSGEQREMNEILRFIEKEDTAPAFTPGAF
ncbi:hypothetical protein [Peptostreptococcus anaerobius]|uniref:hypothetical protein n=1 Tax=Peptostreptococcus anaerobius TaxID=1261 RepID=UPI00321B1704